MRTKTIEYLDAEHEAIPEGSFIPGWYVVETVTNNSREVIAAFDVHHEEEARTYVAASRNKYKLIYAPQPSDAPSGTI